MNSKPISVDIIFVHYKDQDALKYCLTQLEQQTFMPRRVIIVDNSNDLEELESTLPLEILRSPVNLGFAAACNKASSLSESDYILFLNPDAYPAQDCLEQLVNFVCADEQRVCVSSRQLFFEADNILDGTGDAYHFSGLYWRRGYGQSSSREYSESVFSASGAAMMVRRDVFRELGGFDESFFAYGEDVDFGFRLRLLGYEAHYCADAIVRHVGYSSSGGRYSDFSLYYGHRNLVWVFFKNMPTLFLLLFLPAHLLITIASVIKFGFLGKARIILSAKYDAFKRLASVLRDRKNTVGKRKVSLGDLWGSFSKSLLK